MKHIQSFSEFINESNAPEYTLSDCYKFEKETKELWDKLENTIPEQEFEKFFKHIEDSQFQDELEIFNHMPSDQFLYYHQSGATVATGGNDTGKYMNNFESFKAYMEEAIKHFHK